MDVFDPSLGLEKSNRMLDEAKQRRRSRVETEKTIKKEVRTVRRETSDSEERETSETAPRPPATAAEVMKHLGDYIGSIYKQYLSTRDCPPDFHGLHEHLYFNHEVRHRLMFLVVLSAVARIPHLCD